MIVQNSPTPWVVFALIAMIVCGILGIGIGLNPFGPSQEVRDQMAQTQMAVAIRSTENAMNAAATPQAVYAQQTAVVAQLTAIPIQQTATQISSMAEVEEARSRATQTAIAGEAINKQLAIQATQTALAWNQQMAGLSVAATTTALARSQSVEQTTESGGLIVAGLGVFSLFGWIFTRAVTQIIRARAEEKQAQAQFLAEQRRMVAMRASLQSHNGHKPNHSLAGSPLKNPSQIYKLPRAE